MLVIQHWSKNGTVGAETSSQSKAWSFMQLHCICRAIEAHARACLLILRCRYTDRVRPLSIQPCYLNTVSLIDIVSSLFPLLLLHQYPHSLPCHIQYQHQGKPRPLKTRSSGQPSLAFPYFSKHTTIERLRKLMERHLPHQPHQRFLHMADQQQRIP